MSQVLPFQKCHGFGNDFLLVREEDLARTGHAPEAAARRLCHRLRGAGADGMILWSSIPEPGAYRARIFNGDGSEAESSGNGTRCLAAMLVHEGVNRPEEMRLETMSGPKQLVFLGRRGATCRFRSRLGRPLFQGPDLPPCANPDRGWDMPLEAGGLYFSVTPVSMGNPHCVVWGSLASAEVARFGPLLENHPLFPRKANVEWVRVIDRQTITLELWERGAGPTASSGTGSAAAAAACIAAGRTDSPVRVIMAGGEVTVRWDGQGELVQDGEAEFLYRGEYELDQPSAAPAISLTIQGP